MKLNHIVYVVFSLCRVWYFEAHIGVFTSVIKSRVNHCSLLESHWKSRVSRAKVRESIDLRVYVNVTDQIKRHPKTHIRDTPSQKPFRN